MKIRYINRTKECSYRINDKYVIFWNGIGNKFIIGLYHEWTPGSFSLHEAPTINNGYGFKFLTLEEAIQFKNEMKDKYKNV